MDGGKGGEHERFLHSKGDTGLREVASYEASHHEVSREMRGGVEIEAWFLHTMRR